MKDKTYQVTKNECKQRIIANDNVCDECGRTLVAIETTDNAHNPTYWSGCYHGSDLDGAWGKFTNGVKREVFDLAEKLVLNGEIAYRSMKKSECTGINDRIYWYQSQVSGMCSLIRTIEYLKSNPPRQTKEEFLDPKHFL